MILSERHEKLQELKEHANVHMAPVIPLNELCAHINVKPSRHNHMAHYIFSILDDSDNITTHLGHLIVMDNWSTVTLRDDFIVNLIGDFYVHNEKRISSEPVHTTLYFVVCHKLTNLLVVHPDILLSCTHIANSVYCDRRPFFEVKFKRAIGKTDYRLFMGSMLHELYQRAMLMRRFSREIYINLLDEFLGEHNLNCLMNDLDQGKLRSDAEDFYEKFEQWCVSWFPSVMDAETRTSYRNKQQTNSRFGPMLTPSAGSVALDELADIEESVWSPTYGLKGKIDLSWKANTGGKQVIYPYEVKSGTYTRGYDKELSHCAQLALYILMLSDKHDNPFITDGALFYLKDPFLREVKVVYRQVAALLLKRNQLAARLVGGPLSRMIGNEVTCGFCSMTHECMLYHKTVEGGNHVSSRLPKEFFERYTNLVQTEKDVQFIQKWLRLIDLEDASNNFLDREIWSLPSSFKEYTHETCMSDMYVSIVHSEGINNSVYTLKPRNTSAPKDLTTLDFLLNDSVVVSSNDGRIVGLSRGVILKMTEHSVRLSCSNKLPHETLSLRVDRVTSGGYAASSRKNILQLFVDEIGTASSNEKKKEGGISSNQISVDSMLRKSAQVKQMLRNRIVNHSQPRFRPLTDDLREDVDQCPHKLNPHQRHAVERILTAQDYVLIHGMPGTGKTSTISAAVDLLVSKHKKRVLITTFTHTALDNILLKIMETCDKNMRVFRHSSSPHHVHPSLHKYILSKEYFLKNNIPSQSSYIIGCTAASAGSSLMLESIDFDYCIVDEAGQAITPVILGPLRLAQRFVLIGDPLQLPPLVVNQEAAQGGMRESLLAELCKAHPEAVCELSIQYRMNASIMKLSNMIVYSDKLKCGSLEVEKGRLSLPQKYNEYVHKERPTWLKAALNTERPIVFINIDDLGECTETTIQDYAHSRTKTHNHDEAIIVRLIVKALVERGLDPHDIGVISPLNSQIRILEHEISGCLSLIGQSTPMIKTIDKFQGTEKKCIIMSMVRHNPMKRVNDVMLDVNRVNVALTRAQYKLILVGSASTYSDHAPWKDLINHFRSIGAFFNIRDENQQNKRTTSIREDTHMFIQQEEGTEICTSRVRVRKRRKISFDKSLYTSILGIEHLPAEKQDHIISNQMKPRK